MAHDRNNMDSPDRDRISLSEDDQVRDWSTSPGISADELRKDVDTAGNNADTVGAY